MYQQTHLGWQLPHRMRQPRWWHGAHIAAAAAVMIEADVMHLYYTGHYRGRSLVLYSPASSTHSLFVSQTDARTWLLEWINKVKIRTRVVRWRVAIQRPATFEERLNCAEICLLEMLSTVQSNTQIVDFVDRWDLNSSVTKVQSVINKYQCLWNMTEP